MEQFSDISFFFSVFCKTIENYLDNIFLKLYFCEATFHSNFQNVGKL